METTKGWIVFSGSTAPKEPDDQRDLVTEDTTTNEEAFDKITNQQLVESRKNLAASRASTVRLKSGRVRQTVFEDPDFELTLSPPPPPAPATGGL